MLGRNLSIPTGDGNASFRATNDASVVIRYEVSAAYPVYKTQQFHFQRGLDLPTKIQYLTGQNKIQDTVF